MFMEERRRAQQEELVGTRPAEEPQATLPLQPPVQPPLPPSQATRSEFGEADHLVEHVGKLVASPSSAPKAMELDERRQAGDGGVTMMVVAEKCMNGGAHNEEPEHPQAALQAAPPTSVLVLPPSHSVEETEQQMVVVVEMNRFSEENVWKRTAVGTGRHMVGVRGGEEEKKQEWPAGLGGLITRSDPSGTWWFRVRDDGGHGKEDLWKRKGVCIGTGDMVSIFEGWDKEPHDRRQTRRKRERVREKYKTTRRLPESITLSKATYFV